MITLYFITHYSITRVILVLISIFGQLLKRHNEFWWRFDSQKSTQNSLKLRLWAPQENVFLIEWCCILFSIISMFKNYKNFFFRLLIDGISSWIFRITSLVPYIAYILAIKIDWAVLEKIWFFDLSMFVHNFWNFFFLVDTWGNFIL